MRQEHTLDGYIFSARWREFRRTRQVRVAVWFSGRRSVCVFLLLLVLSVFVMCRVMAMQVIFLSQCRRDVGFGVFSGGDGDVRAR